MPTTRRSSSMTGIAPLSVCASSSIAPRASASGATLGTELSMISAAVFIGCEIIRPGGRDDIPAGIESITSVAITDSAAPILAAASRPARACA